MLVQVRHDGRLRLLRQHDHAMLAGHLAAAWVGTGRNPAPLDFGLVMAVALHDVAWVELDESPDLDLSAGRPYPFHALPNERKLPAYRGGLDRLERLHPYGALLGSLHYVSFVEDQFAEEAEEQGGAEETESFVESEARRREALHRRLGLEGEEDRGPVRRDLETLQMFDRLSLFICLAPPSAAEDAQPPWLGAARDLETPDGDSLRLDWRDDEVLHVHPFPFREALDLRLPYRELPPGPYGDREELLRSWKAASEEWWGFSVRPRPRLA